MTEPWEKRNSQTGLFPVPPNEFGILGSSIPLSPEAAQKLFDGPIAAVQPILQADRAEILFLKDLSDPLSPLIDDLLHPIILNEH